MTNHPYLSIVIPAYNEADRIPATLSDMDRRLQTVDFPYEIIVVNDGSRDNTVQVVRGMARTVKNLRVLDLANNMGKGAAVRAGMVGARGAVRIFADADNSTSIDQFTKMEPFFKEGFDVMIGSRAIHGSILEPAEPLSRRVVSRGLNFIVRTLLLPGIRDTQCGFKAFTAEAAERVFAAAKIDGWGFDVEAVSLAKHMGYRVKEVPIRWVNDTRSHVTFSAGFTFLSDITKTRWRLWSDQYPHKNYVQEHAR